MLALVGCGGRSKYDAGPAQTETPEQEPEPDPDARDVGLLVGKRCADFALPEREVSLLEQREGFPMFGPCGHFYVLSPDPVDVWSPDLRDVVVKSALTPRFSPDGTRVAFVPEPQHDRLRRLDLLSGRTFDTSIDPFAALLRDVLGYGLFLGPDGDVRSWVCTGRELHVFADREQEQEPLLDALVPSCTPQWTNDGALLWLIGSTVTVVDLHEPRLFEYEVPNDAPRTPDLLVSLLDGYAAASLLLNDEHIDEGPLFSTRDGARLAERWEKLPSQSLDRGVNGVDSGYALLVDDGHEVVSAPGLRGLYVFRDRARAFAFRAAESGKAELVFADLLGGEITPIAEYTSRVLDEAQPFTPAFGVSPHERVAYFVLGPDDDPAVSPDAPRGVVRWLAGRVERLSETVPAIGSAPGVADDGTAVFSDFSGTVRFRPGVETLRTGNLLGLMLSADGRGVLQTRPSAGTSELVVTNLDDGAERIVASGFWSSSIATDLWRSRFAAVLGASSGTPADQVWAGRFPEPP